MQNCWYFASSSEDAKKYLKMCIRDRIILEVLQETGITATAGIGSNLYLSKVAMDIVAKHIPPDRNGVRIAMLNDCLLYTSSQRHHAHVCHRRRCLRPGDVHRRYHPRHHHGPQPYGRRLLPRQEKMCIRDSSIRHFIEKS